MLFSSFCQYLLKLEGTPSRLEMMYLLAELYQQFEPEDILPASYLMQGSLAPQYLSVEFQLSTKMILRALATFAAPASGQVAQEDLFGADQNTDAALEAVTKRFKILGDIGALAQEVLEQQHTTNSKPQTIPEIHAVLLAIANVGGAGSQEQKITQLCAVLAASDPVSAKYIARVVVGKLRLGFSVMTILDALSWAVVGSKAHRAVLEDAYQKRADVGELARAYLGFAAHKEAAAQKLLEQYSMSIGIPVVPALCQRLNTAEEIIQKMGTVIAEPKYDGLRIQIHFSKDGFGDGTGRTCRAFTRSLEEATHMFPELEQVAAQLQCESCILDAEAIGYDPVTGELSNFQATITRKRKHNIAETAEKTPIRFYIFDCLALNGVSFLDKKLRDRKDSMKDLFNDSELIMYSPEITTSDPVELHQFHEAQLELGLEGAVIKKIDSVYQSGRKGWSWVKIKEAEGSTGKLKDTLDLVVMGYYVGKGKRASFGVGAFLVGVLEEKQGDSLEEYRVHTLAKIGTGLTDEQFAELKRRCDALLSQDKPQEYSVEKTLTPDVWIQTGLVVEIAADELTASPTHSSGFSLRFPRLVRFRDDKNWKDATKKEELESIR